MTTRGTKRLYRPKHPEKYKGDPNKIVTRSNWERIFCVWLDKNPAVLKWSSEEVVVPYFSPIDKQEHRYFVDFAIQYVGPGGEIKNKLIEIKPEFQTMMPTNRRAPSYEDQVKTFLVNQAKWEAAKIFAEKRGMEFQVLTERNLGLKVSRGGS